MMRARSGGHSAPCAPCQVWLRMHPCCTYSLDRKFVNFSTQKEPGLEGKNVLMEAGCFLSSPSATVVTLVLY